MAKKSDIPDSMPLDISNLEHFVATQAKMIEDEKLSSFYAPKKQEQRMVNDKDLEKLKKKIIIREENIEEIKNQIRFLSNFHGQSSPVVSAH